MRKEGEGFQKKVTANDKPRSRHGVGRLEESNVERLTKWGQEGQCSARIQRLLHCIRVRARDWSQLAI